MLSAIWGWLASARAAAYRRGWMPVHRLGRPTVSVGSLRVGGTGKTPAVAALASQLTRHGLQVAILSRGYRRRSRGPVLVSAGGGLRVPVMQAGDEPAWYALTLPRVAVAVDGRRERAAELLRESFAPDVFLLDDAFQHLRVARDVDLLVVDADAPYWQDRPLPTGRLRERPAAARRADAVLLCGLDRDDARRQLARDPGLPVFDLAAEATSARPLEAYRREPSATADTADRSVTAPPQPALAFAAIARPHRFCDGLEHAGIQVAGWHPFPDHHWYTIRELEDLERRAHEAGARSLVTTEKDAVRLPRALALSVPVFVWRHRLAIADPGTLWEWLRPRLATGAEAPS